ncbi:hypothetical protein Dip510_000741 [Elusimicrobium posterum]|uniref:DUF2207 family protein n=1 Tax=Elusimicrobium posterum TaxID=3116653 RepID=UPI003C75C7FB
MKKYFLGFLCVYFFTFAGFLFFCAQPSYALGNNTQDYYKNDRFIPKNFNDKVEYFLSKNQDLYSTRNFFIITGILFFYYFVTWFLFGRDPKTGFIPTIPSAPQGISAPKAHHILYPRGGGRETMLATLIAEAASKNIIEISMGKFQQYSVYTALVGYDKASDLDEDDLKALNILLTGGEENRFEKGDYISLPNTYDPGFNKIANKILEIYKNSFYNLYDTNNFWALTGVFATVLAVAALSLLTKFPFIAAAILSIFLMLLYYFFIGKYTKEGALLKREVEGFKKYLDSLREASAADLLDFLPYSVAFDNTRVVEDISKNMPPPSEGSKGREKFNLFMRYAFMFEKGADLTSYSMVEFVMYTSLHTPSKNKRTTR